MASPAVASSFWPGRRVVKPKADLHARMVEHWVDRAHALGRPGYWEAPGFTPDEWGSRVSICGREQPYGPLTLDFWKYVRLAMCEAFLAEWHRALGTTYETVEGSSRSHAIITGLTS
jgi:hypothetical protein